MRERVSSMSVNNNEEKIVRRSIVYENLEDTAKYLEEMAASGWMLKDIQPHQKSDKKQVLPMSSILPWPQPQQMILS